jgi:dihydrofolate synthase/folylpolyglutamate synthase
MNNFDRFHKATSYIESLSNLPLFADFMSSEKTPHPEIYLKRMSYFLNLLGNPQNGFKFVHITGTAGKGTVATMIHNILAESGKKCGLFTSPHVVSPIERIQVGSLYIAPDEFADLIEKVKPAIDEANRSGEFGRPSQFEIEFAIALLYFKSKKCQWVVLEVGCGGRFDATNIIKPPEVAVITCIDYDHTDVLGKTLKKIAFDKAGIVKRGSQVFTAEKRPALVKMFSDISEKAGATFQQISYEDGADSNRLLALAAGKYLNIPDEAIKKGVETTRLPARFEIVSREPLIIVDGAHNEVKISRMISELKAERFQKLLLVLSISGNKDTPAILKQIIPLADEIFFTRFSSRERKPAPPERLLKESERYFKVGARMETFLDVSDALAEALRRAGKDDCILITGSFFLAGELRRLWYPEERILKNRQSF